MQDQWNPEVRGESGSRGPTANDKGRNHMCRRIVMGLTRLSLVAVVVAMVARDAEAGCRTLPPYMCADWIQGSLFCENLIKGVASKLTKACDTVADPDCTVDVTCSVFGTVAADGVTETLECNNELVPPVDGAECLLKGELACCNPQFHYNDNGNAFNLAGGPFSGSGSTTCTTGGKCFNSAAVDFELDDVCNNNWTPDFSPTEFKGEVCYCPNWSDNSDNVQCCADAREDGQGNCVRLFEGIGGAGTAACLQELCTLDSASIEFCGEHPPTEYQCTVIE